MLAKSLGQVTGCHLHRCQKALHWVQRHGTHPSTIHDCMFSVPKQSEIPEGQLLMCGLRGPAYVETASSTDHQNQWKMMLFYRNHIKNNTIFSIEFGDWDAVSMSVHCFIVGVSTCLVVYIFKWHRTVVFRILRFYRKSIFLFEAHIKTTQLLKCLPSESFWSKPQSNGAFHRSQQNCGIWLCKSGLYL